MKKFVGMSYKPTYGKNIYDLLRIPDSKSLVARLGLGTFKSPSRLDFLLQVSVSWCQSLVSVSKILAETPALVCGHSYCRYTAFNLFNLRKLLLTSGFTATSMTKMQFKQNTSEKLE